MRFLIFYCLWSPTFEAVIFLSLPNVNTLVYLSLPFLQELTLLQHDNVVALLDCKVSQFLRILKN